MTRRKNRDHESCFYCDGLVGGLAEDDHFPIPRRNGGTETVPACVSCHEMKDRFLLADWNVEWLPLIVSDFPNMRRETRIFLAKVLALLSDQKLGRETAQVGV